jgi:L-2,4-diaminobutyric acid acetyltransferase
MAEPQIANSAADDLILRTPSADDGPALHHLIASCPPLDRNSRYCNLLQVTHFADTAVVADRGGVLQGSVTGYLVPGAPDTLFIWQVAVHEQARGQGLATRMIEEIAGREICRSVRWLETTIDPDNAASWRAFQKFAEARGAPAQQALHFSRQVHFEGVHGDEVLLRIGPF